MKDGAADLSFSFNLYGTGGKGACSFADSGNLKYGFGHSGWVCRRNLPGFFGIGRWRDLGARFSNGQTNHVGQVAVATVANIGGLVRSGSNDYRATDASGTHLGMGVAGTGGRGVIEGESLEQSNVDISAKSFRN